MVKTVTLVELQCLMSCFNTGVKVHHADFAIQALGFGYIYIAWQSVQYGIYNTDCMSASSILVCYHSHLQSVVHCLWHPN